MKLFDKRPLSLILCIMLGGFVIFSFSEGFLRYLIIAAPVALLAAALIRKNKRRITVVAAIALAISISASFLYFNIYFFADQSFTGSVDISGRIKDISADAYTSTITVKTDSVDGKKFPSYTLIMKVDEYEASRLHTGDLISFEAELAGFEEAEDYYNPSLCISNGINAVALLSDEIKVLKNDGGLGYHIKEFITNLRFDIGTQAIVTSGQEAGGLLYALIIGDRSLLDEYDVNNFKRIGISHILALSGMHLTILSFAINKFLLFLGFGKKSRSGTVIAFVILYMILTGFPISVVRAGIMLIMTSLMFLLSRSHDAVTSLFVAVTVIVALSPYAIYDIALWLSAFATLGIILISEYTSALAPAKSKLKGFIRWVGVSIITSVFAVIATLPITSMTFGTVSIISPLSNLLFIPLFEFYIHLGCIVLLLGQFIPLGALLNLLAQGLLGSADLISDLNGIYVSVDSPLTHLMILACTLLFYAFAIMTVKNKALFITAIAVSFAAVLGSAYIDNVINIHISDLIYGSNYSTSAFIMKNDGEVSCLSTAKYTANNARSLIRRLEDRGIYQLDRYIMSGYTNSIKEHIDTLTSNCKVDTVYLPIPKSSEEQRILEEIQAEITHCKRIICFEEDEKLFLDGAITVSPIYRSELSDDQLCSYAIVFDDRRILYLSSGMLNKEYLPALSIALCDAVVFGSYGEKYRTRTYFEDKLDNLDTIVMDSENLFLTPDSKDYYDGRDCNIFANTTEISLIKK